MRRPAQILLAIILLVAVAAGLWFVTGRGAGGERAASGPPPPVPVAISIVQRRDVPVTLPAIGAIQAFNEVEVHSRIDGQLMEISFREGQEVKPGDKLAQIDPRTFQAAVDQAVAKRGQDQAQLANARRDLQRYTELVQRQAATRQQYEATTAQVAQLEAAIQADQAAIESAQVQLGYTTITAPIGGRVGIRGVDVGNIVHASDPAPIVVITQTRPISLLFSVPEDRLPDIVEAMQAGPLAVTALSRDGAKPLDEGRLELVDNRIDQSTGTARLKATMPNQRGLLWPGQFVNVSLLLRVQHDALTIPSAALQPGPTGQFAYLVRPDGSVEARPLAIERTARDVAVVARGLAEGDRVVSGGQSRLKPGSRVEEQTASSGAAP